MKKIKVLHFPIRNNAGGVTQYALNRWRFINKSRFVFDFATLSQSLDFENALTEQGCKVHYLSCSAEESMSRFIAEFEAVISENYDVVHLHTSYWKSFICEELAKKAEVPVIIVHSHNTDVGVVTGKLTRQDAIECHNKKRLEFSQELATHFCACSKAAADWLFGPQIKRDSITILNNAIETERFAYNRIIREALRSKLSLDSSFVIGHVGRFEYQKNHSFLLTVFARVSKKIPNAKLMLIGDGSELEKSKLKAKSLGIYDKTLFLGRRNDVAELYQATDLFVFPSLFEGLGIVLIEAQTSGLRCLVSQAAFMPENSVTDNISSLPLDVDLWVNAIIDMEKTGYERRDYSTEVNAAGFSIREQIKLLEKIYSGID